MLTESTAQFYTRLISADHGPGTVNCLGYRPRGSYTRAHPGEVRLLAVLQNPGQPLSIEAERQKGISGRTLAQEVWDMTGECLDGHYRSHTFSKMRSELAQLVGVPEPVVYDYVMITNIVRCTTEGNNRPQRQSVAVGAAWLAKEVELWRPHRVLAYGRWVADAMRQHMVAYDAELPHPAARGKWLNSQKRAEAITQARTAMGLDRM